MTLEGKVNPRLKGALTREEFLEQYSKFIKSVKPIIEEGSFYKIYNIDDLYNHYLEAYKYDEEAYKEWLERRNTKDSYIENIKDSFKPMNDIIDDMLGIDKKEK